MQDLVWTIVPNVGILEPGASAPVSITGRLNATISGPTSAQFKAESLQSAKFALAMVNTTFYYCEEVKLTPKWCYFSWQIVIDARNLVVYLEP